MAVLSAATIRRYSSPVAYWVSRAYSFEHYVEGALIPAGVEVIHLEVDDRVSWVLVVEKEVRS